jgi:predicted dehydrogenase
MKRREFVGKTLIGTAGMALGTSGLLITSCKGANDKIVLALIGSGGRGLPSVISCCQANTNVEIKTVCDVNDLKSAKAVNEIEKQLGYKPLVTRHMKDVFDDQDIDAVWIATPDHWHALATIWACQAGKDVYVEKTPNNCIWEGRKMVEAAKRYKQIVQVGYQNRSAAYTSSARDYIQSGKLGQVVHVRIYNMLKGKKWIAIPNEEVPQTLDWDAWLGPAPDRPFNHGIINGWYYFYAYNVGALNDASHQIDIARMVMGDPTHPKSILGWGGKYILNSENDTPDFQSFTYDFEKFTMTCESGNATNYMSKTPTDIRMDPNSFPEWKTNSCRIEIYGTNGVMYLGRHGGGWQVFGPGEEIVAQSGGTVPDKEHQINFIESIRKRRQPNANIEQALFSSSLLHFANIAYRTGNKQLLFDGANERFIDNNDANKLLKVPYRNSFEVPEKV